MALQKQVVDIPFTAGVDTKTDNILANKLDVLENGFIGQAGTIKKRNGFEELSANVGSVGDYAPATITSGELLLRRKDELLVYGKEGLFSYTPSEASPWAFKSNYDYDPGLPLVQIGIDQISAPVSASLPMSSQMEETATEEIYAINRSDNDPMSSALYYSNLTRKDKETGVFYTDSNLEVISSVVGNTTEIVKVGSKVFWIVKGGASITAYDVTTKSTSYTPQTLKSDAINDGISSWFSTAVLNNKLVLLYVETGGDLRAVTYTLSGSTLTLDMSYTLTTETEEIAGGFAMTYDSVNALYFFGYTTRNLTNRKTKYFLLNSAFALSSGPTQINTAFTGIASNDEFRKAAFYDNGKVYFVFTSWQSTYQTFQTTAAELELSPLSVIGTETLLSALLVSGISLIGGVPCFALAKVSYKGTAFTNYTAYLSNFSLKPVARISSTFQIQGGDGVVSRFQNGALVLAYPANGTVKVTIETDNVTNSNPVETDGVAVVASGAVNMYDGATFSELGFTHAPTIYEINGAGSGTSVPAGAYNYRAIYEYIDTQGNAHFSDVSEDASIILAGAEDVALAIEPYLFTNKSGKVSLKLYRKTETGLIYKLVGTYPTVTVGIVDNENDNSTNEVLYSDGTTSAVITNSAAPVSNIITAHGGRLFAVDEEKTNTVWFTKKSAPGYGLAFNDLFYFQIPESKTGYNERVTGLASLDDKLIIFKNNSIYAVFGDGPNDFGQGSFSDPKLISTDVGCSEARSIINISEGLIFKSQKGIYILSRSLEVSYIGADVEAYNSEEITSAVLLPVVNQVRFTTRSGVALIFNYYYKEWSTFTNYTANHAVMWKDNWTHLKGTGAVRVENTGFLDVATPIRLRVKMSWIKVAGIQALQRIWRLLFIGEWKSAHNITCNVSYDYEDYTWDSYSVDILASGYSRTDKPTQAQIYSGTNDGVYNYEIHLKRQKCQALCFEIYDTDIVGESFSLSGLSLIAGVKNGLDKVASNKKF